DRWYLERRLNLHKAAGLPQQTSSYVYPQLIPISSHRGWVDTLPACLSWKLSWSPNTPWRSLSECTCDDRSKQMRNINESIRMLYVRVDRTDTPHAPTVKSTQQPESRRFTLYQPGSCSLPAG